MYKGITIFTPTYNRADTLKRVYDSLKKQNCDTFEWVIVDDGSTDQTKKYVNQWIEEKKVRIKYYYQENSGKMQAHNKGVELADYELFCCVDSDDYLTNEAIRKILSCWKKISNNNDIIGLLNCKVDSKGNRITQGNIKKLIGKKCTLLDAYRKYGIIGDTMLIYKTEVIKRHNFPKIANEKFVPEAYLYDQLDQEGKLYIQGKMLYACEYLPDGYTASMRKVNFNNPRGYEAYILQRLQLDHLLKYKIEDTIKYVAIEKVREKSKSQIIKESPYQFVSMIFYPLGVLFYYKVYFKYKKS